METRSTVRASGLVFALVLLLFAVVTASVARMQAEWPLTVRRESAGHQATLPYYWTGDVVPQMQSVSNATDTGRRELADYEATLPIYYVGP